MFSIRPREKLFKTLLKTMGGQSGGVILTPSGAVVGMHLGVFGRKVGVYQMVKVGRLMTAEMIEQVQGWSDKVLPEGEQIEYVNYNT